MNTRTLENTNPVGLEKKGRTLMLTAEDSNLNIEDWVKTLKSFTPQDGEVLVLDTLPSAFEFVMEDVPSTNRELKKDKSILFSDFVYVRSLDQYIIKPSLVNPSMVREPQNGIRTAENMPATVVYRKHLKGFLEHLNTDRFISSGHQTSASLATEHLRIACTKWLAGDLEGGVDPVTLQCPFSQVVAAERDKRRQQKAQKEIARKATTLATKKSGTLTQMQVKSQKSLRNELNILNSGVSAQDLNVNREHQVSQKALEDVTKRAEARALSVRSAASTSTRSSTPPPRESEVGEVVEENHEVEMLESIEPIRPPSPEFSATAEARINWNSGRAGLDPYPSDPGYSRVILPELIRLRPDIDVCQTCGEDLGYNPNMENHKCRDEPQEGCGPIGWWAAKDSLAIMQKKKFEASTPCSYPFCNMSGPHVLRACVYLQSRCPTCRVRGHDDQLRRTPPPVDDPSLGEQITCLCPTARQPGQKGPSWAELQMTFENYADGGALTSERHRGVPAAGWHPIWNFKDCAILRTLGYSTLRYGSPQGVIEYLTTSSKMLRNTPGLASHPAILEPTDAELRETRRRLEQEREEKRTANVTPPPFKKPRRDSGAPTSDYRSSGTSTYATAVSVNTSDSSTSRPETRPRQSTPTHHSTHPRPENSYWHRSDPQTQRDRRNRYENRNPIDHNGSGSSGGRREPQGTSYRDRSHDERDRGYYYDRRSQERQSDGTIWRNQEWPGRGRGAPRPSGERRPSPNQIETPNNRDRPPT